MANWLDTVFSGHRMKCYRCGHESGVLNFRFFYQCMNTSCPSGVTFRVPEVPGSFGGKGGGLGAVQGAENLSNVRYGQAPVSQHRRHLIRRR